MKAFTTLKTMSIVVLLQTSLWLSTNALATESERKTGYEVDGRTSASVLAAKRSHQVSDQDKFGLGLYSGILAIGVIVFFAQQLRNR